MRPFLAFVGGFVAAAGLVGVGAATAVLLIVAEPVERLPAEQNVAELWSAEPRRVDIGSQAVERVPGVAAASEPGVTSADGIAAVTTAATRPADALVPSDSAMAESAIDSQASQQWQALFIRHSDWCANRYRSYRPRDDSYTPYSGGRRPCMSPYSEKLAALEDAGAFGQDVAAGGAAWPDEGEPATYEDGFARYAVDDGADMNGLSADHVDYCFSRYRSYRPEDNSYQPYGGGPRRQCL